MLTSTATTGQKIRDIRIRRGLNQAELGRRAGMTRSQTNKIELGGEQKFHAATLKRLASALEVEIEDLLL